ncbi:MAG: hypothetical protein MI920_27075 [Kiloniellales bacterium]|nr:hypothetical protein [Kiloniellales bacterium]
MPSERGKDGNLAQRESRVYPVFRRLAGNAKLRGIFVQTAVLFGLLALFLSSFDNTIRNIDRLGIEVGFDFLDDATGYKVKQQFIEYDEESSHWRALLVGITNTALVAACGIVLATLIGIILHGLRLSGSLLSR